MGFYSYNSDSDDMKVVLARVLTRMTYSDFLEVVSDLYEVLPLEVDDPLRLASAIQTWAAEQLETVQVTTV